MPASLSTPPAPRIVFAEKSDPGCDPKKQINEDSCGHADLPGARLLVVCDGMGGHAGGREASQLAVSTILSEVERAVHENADVAPHDALRNAIKAAGRNVFAMGGPEGTAGRPGSTCVSLLIHRHGTEVAHAGDSRIYLIRNGQIWQLTRDHSLVQQMIDAGTVRPEDALNHPDAHVVTRALGMRSDIDVELRHDPFPHQAGDLFLLVSDGVSDVTSQPDLLSLISRADSNNLQPLCDAIVQFARDRGGPDNITVQAALMLDTAEIEHTDRKTVTDVVPVAPAAPAEGAASTPPNAAAAATPTGAVPPPAPPAVGARGTVVIAAVDASSALATPSPATSQRPPSSDPSRASSKTVVDGGGTAPTAAASPSSRGPKLLIGAGLFVVGLIVVVVSLMHALSTSEAPPPLPETPSGTSSSPASSGAATSAPSTSATPTATTPGSALKPPMPGPATGKGKH
ncbi:MAG: protein phosphatase 2C domain-containing protein [Polyangiaceae bacterium]